MARKVGRSRGTTRARRLTEKKKIKLDNMTLTLTFEFANPCIRRVQSKGNPIKKNANLQTSAIILYPRYFHLQPANTDSVNLRKWDKSDALVDYFCPSCPCTYI